MSVLIVFLNRNDRSFVGFRFLIISFAIQRGFGQSLLIRMDGSKVAFVSRCFTFDSI